MSLPAAATSKIIQNLSNQVPKSGFSMLVRGGAAGAGMYYAVEQDHRWQLPVVFFFPVTYGSYQVFKAARNTPSEAYKHWAHHLAGIHKKP